MCRLLGLEVVVDVPERHLRDAGDVRQGGSLEALRVKKLFRRTYELGSLLRGRVVVGHRE